MNKAVARKEPQAVEPESASNIIQVIERAASNPEIDVEKMERLLAMRERMEEQAAKRAYNAAMNAAQEEMAPIAQDMANSQTRSRYASYTALDNVIRPIYTRHGFSVEFDTEDCPIESHVRVVCEVSHEDGHSKKRHLDIPADGKGAKGGDVMTKTHATMSAVSYGRRGLYKMVWNLAEGADDDGNAASQGDKITEEQCDELIALADSVGADKAAFCAYLKVASLPDILATDFERAKAALNRKGAST